MEQINLFKVFMAESVIDELKQVLYSGFIGEGKKVVEFEKQISEKFSTPYALAVNSGTSALHLAYQIIANYDENSEFIVSPQTCSATLTPIIANRCKIVWADIDPISGNIDPMDIERKITPKTKAIIMVHWGGNPCNIKKINEIAKKYNIKTVEDAAHSLGTKYDGQYLGKFSDFTMFSLQAIKHITSVDGGILCCKDKDNYDRTKLLRWYGIDRSENRQVKDLRCELDLKECGHKFHMNDVNATVGIENLKHLDTTVAAHKANAEFYNEAFKDKIQYAKPEENVECSYWLYTIHVNNRDELMEKLKENNIMSSKVHARNDVHSCFSRFNKILPNVDLFNKTHLCIPVHWGITHEQREYVAEQVLKYAR